jgi:dTDP-4-amino-4,6-dideoxygalactose transaminase
MAWRVPIVDLAAEYEEVGPEVEAAVLRVLRSQRYVLGPETAAFEAELASLVGVEFAVGVSSGTDALALSLRAVGVGPGDEVVTSAFTYFATVEAIWLAGARPVFADIEPDGFGVDPRCVEAALGPRTRAILPVHLFGRCADLPRLGALARAHRIPIVEDAAQAIGAARAGRAAGAWGAAGCFSFYPSKNLGGVGDGGAVTTDDPEIAERLRLQRSHGSPREGVHEMPGTTARLDALQAAALRAKLPRLAEWTRKRTRNARLYAEALAGCEDVVLPAAGPDETPVWNHYTIRCRRAPAVRAALEAEGIEWRHYYPRPAASQPALGSERHPPGSFPEAERACAEVLSIPVRPSLAPAAIERIAEVIRRAATSN